MKTRSIAVWLFACFFLSSPALALVYCGIDVLKDEDFKSLQGAHVGLITNRTGRDRMGRRTIDLFHQADNLTLVCILTPEHGLEGSVPAGQSVSGTIDKRTKVPVYSLYGDTNRPTAAMLEGVDTVVYDIQDVGTRFYTYITTMGMAMEEAARRKKRFVILDRPNPIRGDILEGDILEPDVRRLTGYYSIPTRYGLTVGELGSWYNQTQHIGANLLVVKLESYTRDQLYTDTDLVFLPPSPNIPDVTAAVLYPGVGCFEATNVSVGRGTGEPFNLFGAPWINNRALCAYLRAQNFPGALFEVAEFVPESDLYAGELCHGVRILVTDRNAIRPFQIFVTAFQFLFRHQGLDFKPQWEEVRVVTGSNKLKAACDKNEPSDGLLASYEQVLKEFREKISSYLFYPASARAE